MFPARYHSLFAGDEFRTQHSDLKLASGDLRLETNAFRIAALSHLFRRRNPMATREALQEELNPFEIAKQQFNRAADYLELDDSTRHVLSSAKRQLIVSIPVKMDGGDVQV